MSQPLQWVQHSTSWPCAKQSRFVSTASQTWHIQHWPHNDSEQITLLLHGTGSSCHSWFGLAPLLAQHTSVMSLDLPGHGFSGLPFNQNNINKLTLPGMAQAIAQLLEQLRCKPTHIVGHSAGAAIAIQMALDCYIEPSTNITSINGALLPFGAFALPMTASLTKSLSQFAVVPKLFSWRAQSTRFVQSLLKQTGSQLSEQSLRCYQVLMSNAGHVEGTLQMMAAWDLKTFASRLPILQNRLHLIACANDLTVSPQLAQQVKIALPDCTIDYLAKLGHLGHEEEPQLFIPLLLGRQALGARARQETL
jgi:magnesium chelatase accessory protein